MATRKLTLGQVNGGKLHVLERGDDDTWGSLCLKIWERFHTIEIVKEPGAEPTCKLCLKALGRTTN